MSEALSTQRKTGPGAMGAHGTLEEALANVASFATASQARSPGHKHSSSKSSKHKTQKKHKKSKEKSKDKKASHKKRKRAADESPEDSSNDEGQQPDLSTQLAKGREAARITRHILSEYPHMRGDLREVKRCPHSIRCLICVQRFLTEMCFYCSFWGE